MCAVVTREIVTCEIVTREIVTREIVTHETVTCEIVTQTEAHKRTCFVIVGTRVLGD